MKPKSGVALCNNHFKKYKCPATTAPTSTSTYPLRKNASNALRNALILAHVPVVPPKERVTNLHKALAVIEECDIPEGKYLELCNLLMDVHRRGVIIM